MKFYTDVSRLGNNILFRGYANGKRVEKKVKFKPRLFVDSDTDDADWTDIFGNKLKEIKFDSMSDARNYAQQYADVENFSVHGDINPICQFITGLFPDEIEFDINQIHIFNFDMEVASDDGFPDPEDAKKEVQSIAVKSSRYDKKYHVWGLAEYDWKKDENLPEGYTVEYYKFDDEKEMMRHFIDFWVNDYPDILTGWFIDEFDIPYLINRIKVLFGEETASRLSPWGKVSKRDFAGKFGKTSTTYDIFGIQAMDYLNIFKKFGLKYGQQESYKLDHIAHVVLGESKLSYDEYGSLNTLFIENPQKFISYNIKDVGLVERIDAHTSLLELALTISYKGGVNYKESFGTTAIWDSFIYRYLNSKKIAVPPIERKEHRQFAGGYVKEPVLGLNPWVCSFDLNSLYPSIIVQYNMSPETIYGMAGNGYDPDYFLSEGEIPDIVRKEDLAIAGNGSLYHKKFMGTLPSLIVGLYDERKSVQKELHDVEVALEENSTSELKSKSAQLDNRQMAIKILLNSLYGAVGNQHFRYFDLRIAEGVTLSGQLSIKWAERAVNTFLQKIMKDDKDRIIAIDTDSLYINLDDIVQKAQPKKPVDFLDKVCAEKIEPVIDDAYARLFSLMNANINRMKMSREVIAEKGIWTAKKRYVLNVHDKEGVRYSEPKLKVMGIEAVKSSTPEVVRNKFKEVYKVILEKDEASMQEFIDKFRKEFYNMDPDQIAFPRGVSDIAKWEDEDTVYKKSTPIHVRASILYNRGLERYDLGKKYEEIKDGGKIKFCYLKTPNHFRENVIAFVNYLPKEFELEQYIDYETQFDKTFLEPLRAITNTLNWSTEKIETLEDFFV